MIRDLLDRPEGLTRLWCAYLRLRFGIHAPTLVEADIRHMLHLLTQAHAAEDTDARS